MILMSSYIYIEIVSNAHTDDLMWGTIFNI